MPSFRLSCLSSSGGFSIHDVFATRLASSVSTLFGRKIGADQNKWTGLNTVSIIDSDQLYLSRRRNTDGLTRSESPSRSERRDL